MVLLDTHVLLWLTQRDKRLGAHAIALVDRARADDAVYVSSITYWEIARLQQRGRLDLAMPVAAWRRSIADLGISEIPVTGEIGISADELADLHRDPADRFIVATGQWKGATLVTADERILNWSGMLPRLDART